MMFKLLLDHGLSSLYDGLALPTQEKDLIYHKHL